MLPSIVLQQIAVNKVGARAAQRINDSVHRELDLQHDRIPLHAGCGEGSANAGDATQGLGALQAGKRAAEHHGTRATSQGADIEAVDLLPATVLQQGNRIPNAGMLATVSHPAVHGIEYGICALQMVEHKLAGSGALAQQRMMLPIPVVREQAFKECVVVGVGVDGFLVKEPARG